MFTNKWEMFTKPEILWLTSLIISDDYAENYYSNFLSQNI